MNKVILIGRLTRDPDIRYSQGENQMCVARYTLAVDRRYRKDGEQKADFISCIAFGKSGEFAEKYLHKGIKIAVEGRIRTGSYTNKDDVKVYTTDVVVDNQEFAESKAESDRNQHSEDQDSSQNAAQKTAEPDYKQSAFEDADGFMQVNGDYAGELPFL